MPNRLFTLNKLDLIQTLSTTNDLTKIEAAEIVNLFFDQMAGALEKGDRVEIRGTVLLLIDYGHRSNVGFKGISKIFLGIICRIDFSSYRFTGYFIFIRKMVLCNGAHNLNLLKLKNGAAWKHNIKREFTIGVVVKKGVQ